MSHLDRRKLTYYIERLTRILKGFIESRQKSSNALALSYRFRHQNSPSLVLEGLGNNLLDDPAGEGIVFNSRDITEQERAKEQIQRHRERLEALHYINLSVTSTLDLQTVLDLLLEKIDQVVPYFIATTVRLFNVKTKELELVACRNVNKEQWNEEMWKGGRGLTHLVFKNRSPLIVGNVQTDRRTRNPEFFRRQALVSYFGVPLIAKGQILGVLALYTKEEHEFTSEEIEFLSTIAGQAAIAIQNSQLYEEAKTRETQLQETNRMLAALHSVAAAASQSLDLDAVLQSAIEKITEILVFDATRIHIYDPQMDELFLRASFEKYPERFNAARSFKSGQGIVGTVAESGKPLIFEDIHADPLYEQVSQIKVLLKFGYHFLAVFPIKSRQKHLGTLTCVGTAPRKLSSGEVKLLEALTDQLAVAMENSELYEDVRQKVQELQQKTAELGRANKVKEEFLNVMSHELRTPLNVIMGYTDMIKQRVVGEINSGQEKALGKVMAHSKDLLSVINGILQATTIESGTVKVKKKEFSLSDLLEELRLVYDVPPDRELSLSWDYPPGLPVMKTDRDKLKAILHDLIHNAIKFTAKGYVRISARIKEGSRQEAEENGQTLGTGQQTTKTLTAGSCVSPDTAERFVEFQVEDTGIGIPEKSLPVIFEMFRQLDGSETRSYDGVGLGLYIVKKFTEMLGGTVEVESEPGKGSIFTVTFPCE